MDQNPSRTGKQKIFAKNELGTQKNFWRNFCDFVVRSENFWGGVQKFLRILGAEISAIFMFFAQNRCFFSFKPM